MKNKNEKQIIFFNYLSKTNFMYQNIIYKYLSIFGIKFKQKCSKKKVICIYLH